MQQHVLVVDDFFETLYFLKSALELDRADVSVVGVPSAEEGLLELRQTKYDLLITDVRLPGIDGFDLVRRVRRRFPELPIIVMTGYTSPEVRRTADELAVFGFLLKPLDTEDLLALVNRALGAPIVLDDTLAADPEPSPAGDVPLPLEAPPSMIANVSPEAVLAAQLARVCRHSQAAQATLFRLDGTLLANTRADDGGSMPALTRAIADNLRRGLVLAEHMGNARPLAVQLHQNAGRALFSATVDAAHGLALFFSQGAPDGLEGLLRLVEAESDELRQLLARSAAAEVADPPEPTAPATGEAAEPGPESPPESTIDEPAAGEPAAGEPAAGEPAAGEPDDLSWLPGELTAAVPAPAELDVFWRDVAEEAAVVPVAGSGSISWEEALAQGLVDPADLGG